MNYGPRAMELGAQLLGLIFKKLLKLDGMRAWCLRLGACAYAPECESCIRARSEFITACSLGPVSMSRGPCFMDLVYFNVSGT